MVEGEGKKEIKKGNKKKEIKKGNKKEIKKTKSKPRSPQLTVCEERGLCFVFCLKLLGRNQQLSLNCLVKTSSVH